MRERWNRGPFARERRVVRVAVFLVRLEFLFSSLFERRRGMGV